MSRSKLISVFLTTLLWRVFLPSSGQKWMNVSLTDFFPKKSPKAIFWNHVMCIVYLHYYRTVKHWLYIIFFSKLYYSTNDIYTRITFFPTGYKFDFGDCYRLYNSSSMMWLLVQAANQQRTCSIVWAVLKSSLSKPHHPTNSNLTPL